MTYEDTPKREFKGIWIPAEIWEDDSLSVNEKILYLEIDSFTSQNKSCFISNEHISKLLHISENASSKVLNSLVKKGLVVVTKFDGRKRYIQTIAKQTRQKAKAESPNEQPCIGNKSTYNIQDNNTKYHNITSTNVDVPQSGGEGKEGEILEAEVIEEAPRKRKTKKKAEEKKEKKYTITHRCRLIFEKDYLQKKGIEYYYTAKDAMAVKQIVGKIRQYLPGNEKDNEDALVENFYAFVHLICTSGRVGQWILDNLSLPNINSKFNELYSQLKNGNRQRQQHQNARDDEQSFLDALERRYGSGQS